MLSALRSVMRGPLFFAPAFLFLRMECRAACADASMSANLPRRLSGQARPPWPLLWRDLAEGQLRLDRLGRNGD